MRTKTGIKGFDNLIQGGFPQGKSILLSGTPGTGKTIFSLQYLFNGAKKFKEKGLYITFEEGKDSLIDQAKQFGWDLKALEKKGDLKIIEIPVRTIKENTAKDIIEYVKKNKVSRLVIDSLSALSINTPTSHTKVIDLTEIYIKRFIYNFINDLRELSKVTSIIISQTTNGELSRDGVSEFVCDGILHISYETLGGEFSRNMIIRKMRETKNDEDVHPMQISDKGIIIHNLE